MPSRVRKFELILPKEVEKLAVDWCKVWFPNEAWGLLVGQVVGWSVHVDGLWLPPEEEVRKGGCFKPAEIFVRPEWLVDAREHAKEEELSVVGDFHSHPYVYGEGRVDPVQSAYDLDCADRHLIFGIVNVEETKTKRLRTRCRWWGPSVKVSVRRG